MFYWSICWAGVCATTLNFDPITSFDIRINPAIKRKFCGKDLSFPFTSDEIAKEKSFGEVADRLLSYLTPDTLVLGHAFDNDARMIIDACAKYNVPCPQFDYIDTNVLYNALTNETGERSLSKVAELYGIEFNAHDPLEDARATMAVAKNITGGELLGFLQVYDIEPSRLQNNLIYRGGLEPKDDEQKIKLYRSNLPFIYGANMLAPNELYNLEPHMVGKQDLSVLLDCLTKKNYGFTSTPYSANTQITNNLCLGRNAPNTSANVVKLRDIVCELGLEDTKFDYAPKRIRDAKNNAITKEEYYNEAFGKYKQKGILDNKKISFSKAVEQSAHFENMLIAILQNGGQIAFEVEESNIFIVLDKLELTQHGDQRLRHYRRKKTQQVFDVVEFSTMLAE